MNYIYTLGFIKRGQELLMLNRNKAPWMGIWNGVGGKRNKNELPLQCIIREIFEETGISLKPSDVKDKGIVTWNDEFKAEAGGLHLFLIEVKEGFLFKTPLVTNEGILDWKNIDWVLNKLNLGISYNIPFFLNNVLYKDERYHYHCEFKDNHLIHVKEKKLNG